MLITESQAWMVPWAWPISERHILRQNVSRAGSSHERVETVGSDRKPGGVISYSSLVAVASVCCQKAASGEQRNTAQILSAWLRPRAVIIPAMPLGETMRR